MPFIFTSMENAHAPTPRAKPASDTHQGVASVVLRLLFSLFFRNRVEKLLNQLESLFEAWRDGTLPPITPLAPASAPARPQTAPAAAARRKSARPYYARRSANSVTILPLATIATAAAPHPARAEPSPQAPKSRAEFLKNAEKFPKTVFPVGASLALFVAILHS